MIFMIQKTFGRNLLRKESQPNPFSTPMKKPLSSWKAFLIARPEPETKYLAQAGQNGA